jgi:hypothetical protein
MTRTNGSSFSAKHITRSYEQTINADPARVFDLLCPVKEAEWLDGWDYTLLHSESGLAEEGCVFLSRQEGEKDTIWMITRRDVQNREIEFIRATPDSRIARLTIAVDEKAENRSTVQITYVITALGEEGNTFLEAFTRDNFEAGMKFWEASMNYYLETGQKLRRP